MVDVEQRRKSNQFSDNSFSPSLRHLQNEIYTIKTFDSFFDEKDK